MQTFISFYGIEFGDFSILYQLHCLSFQLVLVHYVDFGAVDCQCLVYTFVYFMIQKKERCRCVMKKICDQKILRIVGIFFQVSFFLYKQAIAGSGVLVIRLCFTLMTEVSVLLIPGYQWMDWLCIYKRIEIFFLFH